MSNPGGGFYVDSSEQREKARRAEQRLLEHSTTRRPRRPSRYRDDEDEDNNPSALPPVFMHGTEKVIARDSSVDRRQARFRTINPQTGEIIPDPDVPPPPVLPPGVETPQYLRPAAARLVPQEILDSTPTTNRTNGHAPRAQTRMPSPPPIPVEFESELEPKYVAIPLGPVKRYIGYDPAYPGTDTTHVTPGSAPLTPSQKKRLRKKQSKERQQRKILAEKSPEFSVQTQGSAPPTPQGPVYPTYPRLEITQTVCDAAVQVALPDGSRHELRCPLRPFPHPGQPHLVHLPGFPEGTELFVGWYLPGE